MPYTFVYGIHNRGAGPHQGVRGHPRARRARPAASRRARCSRCWGRTAPARRRPSASSPRCSHPTAAPRGSPATTSSSTRDAVRARDQPHRAGGRGRRHAHRRREPADDGPAAPRRRAPAPPNCSSASTSPTPRDRRVATYSGGMRRRLDIAMSLVARPQVLFLDEPTTGLDPRSRAPSGRPYRRSPTTATTVLLTTQYLEEADRLADRIAVIDHGRVVAEGTAEELKARVAARRSSCSSPTRRARRPPRSPAADATASPARRRGRA